MSADPKNAKPILTPYIANYMYFNDGGMQRNASIMINAKDIIEAREKAINHLVAHYTYFKITKLRIFNNEHPQKTL